MKIRNDFVTNSSSSSFVVSLIAVDEPNGMKVELFNHEIMGGDYPGEWYTLCDCRYTEDCDEDFEDYDEDFEDYDEDEEECRERIKQCDEVGGVPIGSLSNHQLMNLLLQVVQGKAIPSRLKNVADYMIQYLSRKGLEMEDITHLVCSSYAWCGSDCHDDIELPIELAWEDTPIEEDTPKAQLEQLAAECGTDAESVDLYIDFLNGDNQCYTSYLYEITPVSTGTTIVKRQLLSYMKEFEEIPVLDVIRAEKASEER